MAGSVVWPVVSMMRNGNHGPRVLPISPATTGVGETTNSRHMMGHRKGQDCADHQQEDADAKAQAPRLLTSASEFSINTVGIILMLAGALGLVLSLLFWSSFSPYRRGRTVAGPNTVVEERRIERDLPWHRAELLRLVPAGLGWPLWIDAPAFDLADHIRVHPLAPAADDVGVLSYANQLNFTAVADCDTYLDLEVFTHGVQSALDELARSVLTPAPFGKASLTSLGRAAAEGDGGFATARPGSRGEPVRAASDRYRLSGRGRGSGALVWAGRWPANPAASPPRVVG